MKAKDRNQLCPDCRKKVKNCKCASKKSYKKLYFILVIILIAFALYFFVKNRWAPKTNEFQTTEEAYNSLTQFISNKENGVYMALLLNDRSKMNLSIAINHGKGQDATYNRTNAQLNSLSWWFNRLKGEKLFLIEQAGLAAKEEYSLKKVTNKGYYDKIMAVNFLLSIKDCKIKECDIRKNMFEETDGVFHNTIEYEKIAIKAQDNIMNIIFELGEDYKLSVGELFPKIISPDYNFGYTGNVSNSDLYESLLFEQSSVLFEEECARHMNNKKNVFSITGAMHVPYITENVLFIASSPEELHLILELTSRHFIMRNMLNKMSFEDSCTKYAKICNQLRSLYGTKVPIYYKNIFGHKNVKNVYF